MIRSFFGIDQNPFSTDSISLLSAQQEVYDILKVHCQQGGLCLLLGEPGTGKTIIKESLKQNADKRMVIVTVSRNIHRNMHYYVWLLILIMKDHSLSVKKDSLKRLII